MTERTIDLHLLHCFDALIVEGSVTLAADRLGMSQPGMSNALARLRELLDDPILIRTVKGMAPTQRAIELSPTVRMAIDQLSSIISGPLQFDPAKTTALIRIAGTDGTIACALEPVINEIQRVAPMMRFEVAPLLHKRLQEPLETGTIDLAIGIYFALSPTLYQTKVVDDTICCMVGRESIHAHTKLTLERYLEADHAVVSASAGHRSAVDTVAEQSLALLGGNRKICLTAPYAGLLAMVAARSDMVVTITSIAARMYAQWLPIVVKPLPFHAPSVTFSMVWHERSRNNAALTWVRQRLREGMTSQLDGIRLGD